MANRVIVDFFSRPNQTNKVIHLALFRPQNRRHCQNLIMRSRNLRILINLKLRHKDPTWH
jgi:hypothetical protein